MYPVRETDEKGSKNAHMGRFSELKDPVTISMDYFQIFKELFFYFWSGYIIFTIIFTNIKADYKW